LPSFAIFKGSFIFSSASVSDPFLPRSIQTQHLNNLKSQDKS